MRSFSSLALLLLAAPIPATDIDLKPVYFQTIPYDVLTDARGTPWFRDTTGIHNLKGELVCKEPVGRWLLADRAGRFWFAVNENQGFVSEIRYYDGGKLVEPKLSSRGGVWEDSAGRVYVFDGAAVHILADGKWAKHTDMMPEGVTNLGEARFVEDPKGRVWMWVRSGTGINRVWAFDGKTWTGHPVPGGEDDEIVRLVLPFADDWFLVGVADANRDINCPRLVPFSPSRTADQVAKAKPFAGLPLEHQSYQGEADGGTRYFYRQRHHSDIGADESGYWTISLKGVVAKVDPDDPRQQPDFQLGGPSVTGITAIFTKPGERVGRRLNARECYRDADGRVYARRATGPPYHTSDYSTRVVWPVKEKPGDVLRLTPVKPDEWVQGLFADTAGSAFAHPYSHRDAIRRWDGTKWATTPIEPLTQPKWEKKGWDVPIELAWATFGLVGHSTAGDGHTLFVRVKTRFAVDKDGKFEPPAENWNEKMDPPPFWEYEAWSYSGGKWSDAFTPAGLLKAKRKELIAGRARSQPTPGPCPVLGDGTRLWYAHHWTLTALGADGTARTVAIPKPKRDLPPKLTPEEQKAKLFLEMSTNAGPRPEYRPVPEPLMLATLIPLDARSVMVVVAGTPARAYRASFQIKPPRVTLDPIEADWPFFFPTLHAPADGPPLVWRDHETAPVSDDWIGLKNQKQRYEGGSDLYEYRDGKWAKRADLFKPLAVGDDGGVWCSPTDWNTKPRGTQLTVCRLHQDRVERYDWNYGDEVEGCVKPASGAAILDQLCIEPPTKPSGKAVLRMFPCADRIGANPLVLSDGTLLIGTAHGKLFDPKAK